MLIEWMKESVTRCFSKSYKLTAKIASLPEKMHHKTISRQPDRKFSFVGTEIRLSEKSKGGLAFEVLLVDSKDESSPKRPPSPPKSQTSLEEINNKLKAAEERKQLLESQKLKQLAEKWSRIEDASTKKAEHENNFVNQTKEQLDKKMLSIEKNREIYIDGLRAKLKDHEDRIATVRKSLENQKVEIKETIDKKLAAAQENRVEMQQKMVDKLKEHDENVEKVRRLNEEKFQQLEELKQDIERKLEIAQSKREAAIAKKRENLKEHVKHVLEVKQLNEFNVQSIGHQTEFQLQKRLERANENKKCHEMACKAKRLKRDRHVEEVRQSKTQTSSG